MQETRIVLRNVGKINPVKACEYAAAGGYEGLKKAFSLTQDQVIGTLKESGLRGRGGAGFPAGLKWQFVKNTPANQKYIVCNADEGEPGTNKDRVILAGDPNSVFEGMAIAGFAVGADKGYIYLRAEYPSLLISLNEALADARANGFLGKNIMGGGFDFDIEVRSGAGAYVCGEETALIESIEGKRGEPRFKPPYPGVSGLWGAPTVVNNVETLANVAQILINGAAWFKAIGTEACAGTKLFTLCGNIANPGVYEFPMGVNLKDLFAVGGGCPDGKKLLAVQTGGSSGSFLRADQIDLDMDIDNCAAKGATLGSGAILFIDETNCILDVLQDIMEFFVHESCGKCTPCREGNFRLLQMITAFNEGRAKEGYADTMLDLSSTMMSASLCGLGQSSPTAIVTSINNFRDVFCVKGCGRERGNK
ncbi:MAG: NADH-quinone oxidoreductase subunit NuoF [Clostridiales bacterium]|nr:NADH-quinone oxidoreductase subunit NuoF [Clostridiales bacterium]